MEVEIKLDKNIQTSKKNSPKRKRWKIWLIVSLILGITLGLVATIMASRWKGYLQKTSLNQTVSGLDNNIQAEEPCTNILNPDCWTEAFKPSLQKVDNKTNVLIVGSDVRGDIKSDKVIGNTDTIMLVTYYYDTNQTRMISFPRDLYAPYQYKDGSATYKDKINQIYYAGSLYGENKEGHKVLKRTIEQITGEQIQYTTVIHLHGVVKAIDAIGGIDINLPKDHTDVYPKEELPADLQKSCIVPRVNGLGGGFCLFKYKAGPQHMDGQKALIYARMRELSSDFDRGRRQQEVIDAIKETIMSSDKSLPEKADLLFSVYQSLGPYINLKFDLNLEIILAGLDIAQKYKEEGSQPIKIVMDPAFGGGGVVIKGTGSNYNFSDYTFKNVKAKLKLIEQYSEFYQETPKVSVVNATGVALAKDNPANVIKNSYLWFLNMTITNAGKDVVTEGKSGVEIIDYNGLNPESVERLKNEFSKIGEVTVTLATSENGLKPKKDEDIAVFIYPQTTPTVTPVQ